MCDLWDLSTPCDLGHLLQKAILFSLLPVKSFKYDKQKPILNSEIIIWLRLKERGNFWIKKLKTLASYGLNQELN